MPLFTKSLDIKLIQLVKDNPVLYNPAHSKHTDFDTRVVTWQKIGDALYRPPAEFAGIQCHIQFGDYNEEKHKPGLIENLNEYLPEQYSNSWGMEKKVFKEWSKHVRVTELEAKHLYTKTARSLPTYGVTFFLVKEVQKGKKKLIHRLLGINAQAILRLDERTKEILKEWPLTHVKTYSAGKGNSFTLNFGDYTDEEYSVKTRDAFRIRDILEGYIDLIRKRMLAQYNHSNNEYGYLMQDSVGASQASTITVGSNSPMKLVEQSFVGPSKIVQYEPGQKASSGAQIVTVQQMVASGMIAKQGQGVKGELLQSDTLNRTASCRLKRVNSKSVKVVTLLTEPNENNIKQARKLVEEMDAHMPYVKQGIQKSAENQSEDNRKKLEEQMLELDELIKLLAHSTEPGNVNTSEAEAAAIKIAEASTKMYLSMDPSTQRRSLIITRQRSSFIADERTEKSLRRASYIAATGSIDRAIHNTHAVLYQEYNGPAVDDKRAEELEKSALDKLGKINAAIAHHLLAHSDPSNVDYATAVNSLNTIHELLPELAKDAQALASIKDGKSRQELLDSIRDLSEAAKAACLLTGKDENKEKHDEVLNTYTQAGSKLLFILGRGTKPMGQKEKQVTTLAYEVETATCVVVQSAQKLSADVPSEPALAVYAAATRALADSNMLCRQAELTAPTISEPHCQSALTAASETLSSSIQHLAATWSPLVEDKKSMADKLHRGTMDVANALDKLTCCYAGLGANGDVEMQEVLSPEQRKLKFVHTLGKFQNNYDTALQETNKPVTSANAAEVKQAEDNLSKNLAQLNAAVATLARIYADNEPDYGAAESAISAINDLMPLIAKDTKISCGNKDPESQAIVMEQLQELYKAMAHLGAEPEAFAKEGTLPFAEHSGKLYYTIGKRINPQREDIIMDLAMETGNQASVLLAGVQGVAEGVGGVVGGELDEKGAELAEAVERMVAAAQITSPSISHPACKSHLLSTIDEVSKSADILRKACSSLENDPTYKDKINETYGALNLLEEELNKLRAACDIPDLEEQQQTIQESPQEQQKLRFIMTMQGAKEKLEAAEKELDKAVTVAREADMEAVKRRLADRLHDLKRAIDSLQHATHDADNPNYEEAQKAMTTITELMPLLVQDTKTVSYNTPDSAELCELRELCRATEALCTATPDTQDFKEAVMKFKTSTDKLVFVILPRTKPHSKDLIVSMAQAGNKQANAIQHEVQKLSEAVGGTKGTQLNKSGEELKQAAHELMILAEKSESPSKLLASIEQLQQSALSIENNIQELSDVIVPATLHDELEYIDNLMDNMKNRLEYADYEEQQHNIQESPEQQKLRFILTMKRAKRKLEAAEKELEKPVTVARETDMEAVKRRLTDRLHNLRRAIDLLQHATHDIDKPDHKEARKAMTTITQLTPLLVQDTKTVSHNNPDSTELCELRELCRATEQLCKATPDTQDFKEAVMKFKTSTDKLVFVVSPRTKPHSRDLIVSMAQAGNKQAHIIQHEVQKLSEAVGGTKGTQLNKSGEELKQAAHELMILAEQLESPSKLHPSIDRVSQSSASLRSNIQEVRDVTGTRDLENQLKEIDELLNSMRAGLPVEYSDNDVAPALPSKPPPPTKPTKPEVVSVKPATTKPEVVSSKPATTKPEVVSVKPATKPEVCIKPTKPLGKAKPEVPKRIAHPVPNKHKHVDITQDFLHNLRCEESQGHQALPSETQQKAIKTIENNEVPTLTEEEIQAYENFVKIVGNAAKNIRRNEKDLVQLSKSESVSEGVMSNTSLMLQQEQLQKNLALAGVEVANIVAASYVDKIDYEAASKSTTRLSELMAKVAENGKKLSNNVDESARKPFLHDVIQVCAASRKICDAATDDPLKLNEAAIEFGDKSAKLLSLVSADVDPSLEKEIISRTKAIGNSASRLASNTSAAVTSCSDDVISDMCDVTTRCVHDAGKLVYTAKVVAPMLHEPCCQETLISSIDSLSTKLNLFRNSSQHIPNHQHLVEEVNTLDKLLVELKGDVRGGTLMEKREMENLVVENTPMRELTVKILEGAKAYTESPDIPAPVKVDYAAYSDRLGKALRALDLANARCRRTPHDTNKRRELENAIQNLQMILLQSRPTRGEKGNSNIVDLRDFIEEVSTEAKGLTAAAYEVDVSSEHDKIILGNIREKCGSIETKAQQLMNYDDILEIDQLGQECDNLINQINKDIKGIEDAKAKRLLLSKILPLTESTHMLRFATKSSIAATDSASLDSTLDDLDDIETRVIPTLVQDNNEEVTLRPKQTSSSSTTLAANNLCRELTSPEGLTRGKLTAYIAATKRPVDNKLMRHIYKLVHLVKALTVARSRHAALWQLPDSPLVAQITDHILQEIQNNTENGTEVKDISKLFIPSAPKILSDKTEQEESLQTLSSQLSSLCGELKPSSQVLTNKPLQQFQRLAPDVVAAAVELDAVARGTLQLLHPMQKKQVDEAAKEMKFETYNVLQIAQQAAKEPRNTNLSRRLAAACEKLNASINKLARHSTSLPPLSQSCASHSRELTQRQHTVSPRPAPAPYEHAVAALDQQKDNIYKLKNDSLMSRQQLVRELDELGAAVRKSTDIAENCAYFIAVSDEHKDIAKTGLVDVEQIQKCIESIQDSCMAIIGASEIIQAQEEKDELHSRVQQFSWSLEKAQAMVKDEDIKQTLARSKATVCDAAQLLENTLKENKDLSTITTQAVDLLQAVSSAHGTVEHSQLVPAVTVMSPDTRGRCEQVIGHSKTLLSHTIELLADVKSVPVQQETISWNSFPNRRKVIDSYDALVKTVKVNGHRSGILLDVPMEELEEVVQKSYLETQVDLANKWLKRQNSKPDVKAVGQQAVRNVVELARQMSDDQPGAEREETRHLITEIEELLCQCNKTYSQEKNAVLMDRIKELKKCIQRGVVTRVVEDFMHDDDPLLDLDILADTEKDSSKRTFILERKIASLLSKLGRVTRTARLVAQAGDDNTLQEQLTLCNEQTELLAPMLVKVAQERMDRPDDQSVVEKYKSLLAQYAESMSKVRNLCDRAVNPMDFVQAAGDTMQRMREDMTQNIDPQKCHYTSTAINRLANRVMYVGLSSPLVRRDPTMSRELSAVESRLRSAIPAPDTRASKLPDWKDSTAQVIRMTGDVESVLGGENIFKQQPTTANQPIYSVARDLHESVREWSSRDNEIVGTARRMAVLMAKLSNYMETDEKQALISTSKSIVLESQEVAELAKKLAHECTDVRIKNNLLQLVERIPTISGQLKMLITVKGSSLGQQGNFEDKEAMDMLVVNAQSLMISIQEVVKAAAGASVKIMSQRGPRLKWVRNNYY